jgi:hypothetical protein
MKPKIFQQTIYRLPTKEELLEINSCNLSVNEIINGFSYTIIGRGISSLKNKKMIIESIKLLTNQFPNNKTYKEALEEVQNKYQIFEEEDEEKSYKQEKKHASMKTVKDMLNMPYDEFVKVLKDNASDERINTILNLGQKDGIPTDEIVKVTFEEYNVNKLLPTQSQIGIGESFFQMVKHNPTNPEHFIKHPDEAAFPNRRILTANGKFIIDGHHRWSQIFLFNPNAKICAINIEIPGIKEPKTFLKIVQLAIAATYKGVYTKQANSQTDIFSDSMTKEKIIETVKEILPENVIELCKKSYGFDSDEKVYDKIANNGLYLKKFKPEFAPERKYMPQPSDTAEKAGKSPDNVKGLPGSFLRTLQTGKLNFKKPFINPTPTPAKKEEPVTQESYFISFNEYKNKYNDKMKAKFVNESYPPGLPEFNYLEEIFTEFSHIDFNKDIWPIFIEFNDGTHKELREDFVSDYIEDSRRLPEYLDNMYHGIEPYSYTDKPTLFQKLSRFFNKRILNIYYNDEY